jgi:saccharopine dehydrogenase-like NADP-dependent oxidoreductase
MHPVKVLILGTGHIGQTIAELLSSTGDYEVSVADQHAHSLQALSDLPVKTYQMKADDSDEVVGALKCQHIVINALPYFLAAQTAQAAARAGCHYFDLTEDVHATREIQRIAQGAKQAFMPQCGLAPGFISIVAQHLASQFDDLHELHMRVGALPAFPTNSLKYNLTWSVDGLINEYCRPCEAIRDCQTVELLPLEGLEHFSLDGVEYEAFNTSGGLGTLCDSLAGRVKHLDYKSVRYPGHRHLMKILLEELQLQADQDALKRMMRKAIPTTMQDVVLVFVTASGYKRGVFVQEVFARKIFADRDAHTPKSAIQITTAAGVCAVVDLFCSGALPQQGFLRQEQVSLPDFLANRFGQVYQQWRQIESIS